ncbi:M20/M25/M40 family metallo-hydrolase [Aquipuribacter nitratireducens]|uniref:M20/M25/M40 family metallo-hydrolase n=1 Tax=Aquipuribacter nitratireducens TaxID=650104 RepID=A0ABW0GIU7_9MICO
MPEPTRQPQSSPLRPPAADVVEATRERVAGLVTGTVETLERLVRIPSVSAAAFDQAHVEASADAVASLLRDAGMPDVEVLRAPRPDGTPGAPAVVARRPAPPGAPTVLLYAHHDVQPPGEASRWTSPPFEPTRRGERLYGRGAADDKAGICAHLAAVRAHLAAHDDGGGVGLTVFVEGEEEVGSPSFQAFLAEHAGLLRADVLVVADSTNAAVGTPAVTTTLRGLVQAVVEVRTLDHALHSGMFGGAVPDPAVVLLRLLASLHDADGGVAVPGLGDMPPHARAAAAAQSPYPAERFREEAGVLEGVALAGAGDDDVAERVWAGPAVTVIGLDLPSVEHASNTVQPVVRARVSVRVPPGADPATAFDALRQHLLAQPAGGARVVVESEEQGHGFAADTATTGYAAARWALGTAWGSEPVDIGVGGSIPFIADLDRVMPGAAVLVTGVEDPDSRAHGIDESLHLGEFARVCLAEALLLEALTPRA